MASVIFRGLFWLTLIVAAIAGLASEYGHDAVFSMVLKYGPIALQIIVIVWMAFLFIGLCRCIERAEQRLRRHRSPPDELTGRP
jgi:uncharacterized membrane protein